MSPIGGDTARRIWSRYNHTMFDLPNDARVRKAAFGWLALAVTRHGDVLPRTLLEGGFELDGETVRLVGPQGIFKPKILELPLSITTAPDRPYADSFENDLLLYHYRRGDPNHRDNEGLRTLMKKRLPLVYLHGIVEGKYLAAWPVFIVGDDAVRHVFRVAVDDHRHLGLLTDSDLAEQPTGDEGEAVRRVYSTAVVRVRLHQRAFRERVLEAYRRQCSFCQLRHDELLDAAHLIPDSDPSGDPLVTNGIALCALHHAAFDRYFIGISPDYKIVIRADLLREKDGPTLAHAIQGLHGKPLHMPRRKEHYPSAESLALRFKAFEKSAKV